MPWYKWPVDGFQSCVCCLQNSTAINLGVWCKKNVWSKQFTHFACSRSSSYKSLHNFLSMSVHFQTSLSISNHSILSTKTKVDVAGRACNQEKENPVQGIERHSSSSLLEKVENAGRKKNYPFPNNRLHSRPGSKFCSYMIEQEWKHRWINYIHRFTSNGNGRRLFRTP